MSIKAETFADLATPQVAAALRTLVELAAGMDSFVGAHEPGKVAIHDRLAATFRDMPEGEQRTLRMQLTAELLAVMLMGAMPFVFTGIDVGEALTELVESDAAGLLLLQRAMLRLQRLRPEAE